MTPEFKRFYKVWESSEKSSTCKNRCHRVFVTNEYRPRQHLTDLKRNKPQEKKHWNVVGWNGNAREDLDPGSVDARKKSVVSMSCIRGGNAWKKEDWGNKAPLHRKRLESPERRSFRAQKFWHFRRWALTFSLSSHLSVYLRSPKYWFEAFGSGPN